MGVICCDLFSIKCKINDFVSESHLKERLFCSPHLWFPSDCAHLFARWSCQSARISCSNSSQSKASVVNTQPSVSLLISDYYSRLESNAISHFPPGVYLCASAGGGRGRRHRALRLSVCPSVRASRPFLCTRYLKNASRNVLEILHKCRL